MFDSFGQFVSSDFFIVLAGVVMGGAITAASTLYFEWRRELIQRRNVAIQLLYRINVLTSDLINTRKQIFGSIDAAKKMGAAEKDYWALVQALIGMPEKTMIIDASELGWMHKKEDVALSMEIIELIKNYNLIVALMNRYNEKREEIEIATVEHANVRITPEAVVGEISFDARAHPNLVRMIGNTNKILLELVQTLDETSQTITGIIEQLNSAIPKYFPRGYFKLKIKLVDEDDEAMAHPVMPEASPTSSSG